jgi:radical SAM superfamily enzyme with C-terminal helix-hairpin-helix motif
MIGKYVQRIKLRIYILFIIQEKKTPHEKKKFKHRELIRKYQKRIRRSVYLEM